MAIGLLDRPAPGNDAAANLSISLRGADQKCAPFPAADWPERALPGWDNLWIDLGGEG
jgi:hypothetical protein